MTEQNNNPAIKQNVNREKNRCYFVIDQTTMFVNTYPDIGEADAIKIGLDHENVIEAMITFDAEGDITVQEWENINI